MDAISGDVRPSTAYVQRTSASQRINCDFVFHNESDSNYALREIALTVVGRGGRPVLRRRVDDGAIVPSIDVLHDRTLEAGGSLSVFNPFHRFEPWVDLATLRFAFAFETEDGARETVEIRVEPATYVPETSLRLPLEGRLSVSDGHDFYAHHRRMDLTHPVVARMLETNPSRFAYGLCHADDRGRRYETDGATVEDWYAYGRPVFAPAEGEVAEVVNDEPDYDLDGDGFDLERTIEDPSTLGGNYVVIDHGNGEYSYPAHLGNGSVTVRPGDRVEPGDRLGTIGFSGSAGSRVHLHYELRDGVPFDGSEGLPAAFEDVVRDEGSERRPLEHGVPRTGEFVESTR